MKEEFDEELILWSKGVLMYCKQSCLKCTAIQAVVKGTDVNCKYI